MRIAISSRIVAIFSETTARSPLNTLPSQSLFADVGEIGSNFVLNLIHIARLLDTTDAAKPWLHDSHQDDRQDWKSDQNLHQAKSRLFPESFTWIDFSHSAIRDYSLLLLALNINISISDSFNTPFFDSERTLQLLIVQLMRVYIDSFSFR